MGLEQTDDISAATPYGGRVTVVNEAPPHCLYFGRVMHTRVAPFKHQFEYRVFSVFLDIDRLQELPEMSRLFSHNKFNLFGFYDTDHGAKDGVGLRTWIESELKESGIVETPKTIKLFCYPRILGYVFNPLSIFYCYDERDRLMALLYEVSNTFGERHLYVAKANITKDSVLIEPHAQEKVFYVSPFFEVKGDYLFRVKKPERQISLRIELSDHGQPLLFTAVSGDRRTLKTSSLLKACFKYPLMTFKVIGAIHWEALRLWVCPIAARDS
jgi:DUF1365 family protein